MACSREGRHLGSKAVLVDVVGLVEAARRASARTVNALITATYWTIGRRKKGLARSRLRPRHDQDFELMRSLAISRSGSTVDPDQLCAERRLVIGLVTSAVLALLVSGLREATLVVMIYLVIKTIFQAIIQPKVVGDAVDLSPTRTFVSVISWGGLLGALGALLTVPLTLLVKVLLIDSDPAAGWLVPLLCGSGGRKSSGEHS